ncbi:hypothetical protein EDM56_28285 [Brevibacillus fluminis]|uniref:Uncharacterized protein n=1 Tax=Brevibacillus fluminis TaxID=511487 RepID=A0A3M8CWU8_9BACL|nr:hypothetical protein EDM56_28285 [Brevibacillus fluminis]
MKLLQVVSSKVERFTRKGYVHLIYVKADQHAWNAFFIFLPFLAPKRTGFFEKAVLFMLETRFLIQLDSKRKQIFRLNNKHN